MIKFIKITSSRFISNESKFSLIKYNDSYQILYGSKVPKWTCNFSSVKYAEDFLNSHDYIHASSDKMPMSADDIEYIVDMYGFKNVGHNKWTRDGSTLNVGHDGYSLIITDRNKEKKKFDDPIEVIDYLDNINGSIQMVKCSSFSELKRYITAASAREITRNLVRVKSSNIWAYCIEIKDRHDKIGTLYIQFKGRNGGPGDIYEYEDVPINVWRKMLASPSKGHAFWKLIRNNYMYRKLTGDRRTHLKNGI